MNNFYKEVLEDMIADAEFDALTPEDDLDEAIDIMTDEPYDTDIGDNVIHDNKEDN
jgi:hypothetical protein